jgi:hypothetical protein
MYFDLKGYAKDNSDRYGDAPLEDIAKDVFQSNFSKDPNYKSYDDWKSRVNIAPDIQDDSKVRSEIEAARNSQPGLLEEIGRAAGRGIVQDIPSMVGKTIQRFSPEGGLIHGAGKSLEELGQDNAKRFPGLTASKEAEEASAWSPRGFLTETARFAPVIAGSALLATAGAGAATAMGLGTAATAAAGSIAAALPIYGSTAEDSYRQAKEKGLSEDDANEVANLTGGIMAVGYHFARMIPAKLFGGLSAGAQEGILSAITSRMPAQEIAKKTLQAMGTEAFTFAAQQGAKTYAEQQYGITDKSVLEEAANAIPMGLTLGLVFSAAGTAFDSARRKGIRDTLSNPESTPKDMSQAINEVASAAYNIDPKFAEAFAVRAKGLYEAGQPVIFDSDTFYQEDLMPKDRKVTGTQAPGQDQIPVGEPGSNLPAPINQPDIGDFSVATTPGGAGPVHEEITGPLGGAIKAAYEVQGRAAQEAQGIQPLESIGGFTSPEEAQRRSDQREAAAALQESLRKEWAKRIIEESKTSSKPEVQAPTEIAGGAPGLEPQTTPEIPIDIQGTEMPASTPVSTGGIENASKIEGPAQMDQLSRGGEGTGQEGRGGMEQFVEGAQAPREGEAIQPEAQKEVIPEEKPLRYDPSNDKHNGEKLRPGDTLTDNDGNTYRLDRNSGFMLTMDQIKDGKPVGIKSFSVDPTDKARYRDLFKAQDELADTPPEPKVGDVVSRGHEMGKVFSRDGELRIRLWDGAHVPVTPGWAISRLDQPAPEEQSRPEPQTLPSNPVTDLGSEGYIQAKKQPDGNYKLFFRGTRNEIFPDKTFNSPKRARDYWLDQKQKQDQTNGISPDITIMSALSESRHGAPVEISQLRDITGLKKKAFDAAMLEMQKSGKIQMVKNAQPIISLTDEDLAGMIPDGKGNHYMAVNPVVAHSREVNPVVYQKPAIREPQTPSTEEGVSHGPVNITAPSPEEWQKELLNKDKATSIVGAHRLVELEKTGAIKSATKQMHSAFDVARTMNFLADSPQEAIYMMGLDSDGGVTVLHKYSKGTNSSSALDVKELTGNFLRDKKTTRVYFIHNHPSGTTAASTPDKRSFQKIGEVLGLNQIQLHGMIIANSKFATFDSGGNLFAHEIDTPILSEVKIPVKERTYKVLLSTKPGNITSNPTDAVNLIKNKYGNSEGMLLLDGANRDLGFIPFPKGKTFNEAGADIISAAERVNASAAVISSNEKHAGFGYENRSPREKFLTQFISAAHDIGFTIHDVMIKGKSTLGSGYDPVLFQGGNRFDTGVGSLSRSDILLSDKNTTGEPIKGAGVSAEKAREELGVPSGKIGDLGYKVVILDDSKGVPNEKMRDAILTYEKENNRVVKGFYDPKNKSVYIMSGRHESIQEVAKTIIHEVVGHLGFYEHMGEDLKPFLDFVNEHPKYGEQIRKVAEDRKIDMSSEFGRDKAAKEWFAGVAEEGSVEPSLWSKFIVSVKNFLAKLGFKGSWINSFDDNDLAEEIRASWKAAEGTSKSKSESKAASDVDYASKPIKDYPPKSWAPEKRENVIKIRKQLADGKIFQYSEKYDKKLEKLGLTPADIQSRTIQHIPGKKFAIGFETFYGPPDPASGDKLVSVQKNGPDGKFTVHEWKTKDGKLIIDGPIFSRDKAERLAEIEAIIKGNLPATKWYHEWNGFMMNMVNENKGLTREKLEKFIMIQAILSSQSGPQGNMKTFKETIDALESKVKGRIRGVSAIAMTKVRGIWDGSITKPGTVEEFIKEFGPKVGPYMATGLIPSTPVVVIDRHMPRPWGYDIVIKRRIPKVDKTTGKEIEGQFVQDTSMAVHDEIRDQITSEIKEVAERMGLDPGGVQAALWYGIRPPDTEASSYQAAARIGPDYIPEALIPAFTEDAKNMISYHGQNYDVLIPRKSGEEVSTYSNEIRTRMEEATPEYPFIPLTQFYASGTKGEVSVLSKNYNIHIAKIKDGEVYDGIKDPLGYWKKARDIVSDSKNKGIKKPELNNVFLGLIKNSPHGFKGVSSEFAGNRKVISMFEAVPAEHSVKTSVNVSEMVDAINNLPNDAGGMLTEVDKRNGEFVSYIKGVLKDKTPEVQISKISHTVASFSGATSGKMEYGLDIELEGPLESVKAAFSIVGISKSQRLVFVGQDAPDGGKIEPNGITWEMKIRKDATAADITKSIDKHNLTDYNIKKRGGDRWFSMFIPDGEVARADAFEAVLGDVGTGHIKDTPTLSEALGSWDDNPESMWNSVHEDYRKHIVKHFGEEKGGEIYDDAITEGSRWRETGPPTLAIQESTGPDNSKAPGSQRVRTGGGGPGDSQVYAVSGEHGVPGGQAQRVAPLPDHLVQYQATPLPMLNILAKGGKLSKEDLATITAWNEAQAKNTISETSDAWINPSSIPKNEEPKKTITAYKLFRTLKGQPGKIYPLFIGNGKETPIGSWIKAEFIPTKGFAERPGWHVGATPQASHLMSKEGKMLPGRVWAEVEIPADKNWQEEADKQPTRDIKGKVPEGGHYRFKRPANQGGEWMIAGAMKVKRILSEKDVNNILSENSIDFSDMAAGAERQEEARNYSGFFRGSREVLSSMKKYGKEAVDGLKALGMPTAVSPEHYMAAVIMGSKMGAEARMATVSKTALRPYWADFNKLGVSNKNVPIMDNFGIKFMLDIDEGEDVDPRFRPAADAISKEFDKMTTALEQAGAPVSQIENYFPRIWTQESRRALHQALSEFELGSQSVMDLDEEERSAIKERVDELLKDGKGTDGDLDYSFMSKKPLKGSEHFRKKRKFDDMRVALELGLVPQSRNPIDIVMSKLSEMGESLLVNQALREWEDDGSVMSIPYNQKVPVGMFKINDKYGTIYGPPEVPAWKLLRELAKSAKKDLYFANFGNEIFEDPGMKEEIGKLVWRGREGQTYNIHQMRRSGRSYSELIIENLLQDHAEFEEVAPNLYAKIQELANDSAKLQAILDAPTFNDLQQKFNVGGFVVKGSRVATRGVSDILNNYLSQNLYNNRYFGKGFKTYMAVGNTLNQAQLGMFSLFHAGFETVETGATSLANNIGDIYGLISGTRTMGDVTSGLLHTLGSPYLNAKTGTEILREYERPGSGSAYAQMVSKAIEIAGGRAYLESAFQTNSRDEMMRHYYSDEKIKAALSSPKAFLEMSSAPLMNWFVPALKVAAFGEKVSRLIKDNPGKELEELAPLLRKAWSFTDASMGQVVYDRLFVNNTAKNVLQAIIRAPGWTGGTIVNITGGLKDAGNFLGDWAKNKKAPNKIPDRVAYTIALLLGAAVVNGILTKLLSGKDPEGMDYWAFRTGGKDEYGRDERYVLPSYTKDIMAYYRDPVQTVTNKTHPLINMIAAAVQNKDYYGTKIRNEDDPLLNQGADLARYGISQYVPFWMRGIQRQMRTDTDPREYIAPLVGIMPAPSYFNKTKAELLMSDYISEHQMIGGRTKEQTEKADLIRTITRKFVTNKPDEGATLIREATDKGKLSARDIRQITTNVQTPPTIRAFKRLSPEEAIRVWAVATDAEKVAMRPVMETKRAGLKNAAPEKFKALDDKFAEALSS